MKRTPDMGVGSAKTQAPRRPLYQTAVPDFKSAFMAIERVERQLRDFTQALDAAQRPYAVIGGNAVAAWVSSIDPDAIRSTKDIDVLLRRSDFDLVTEAVRQLGMVPAEVSGTHMFQEEQDPSPKRAVHIIFADEPIRSHDPRPAPSVTSSCRSRDGYLVLELALLVRMKLEAYRLRDQTHLVDMLSIGLIDADWTAKLPADLQPRFLQVLEAYEREEKLWG